MRKETKMILKDGEYLYVDAKHLLNVLMNELGWMQATEIMWQLGFHYPIFINNPDPNQREVIIEGDGIVKARHNVGSMKFSYIPELFLENEEYVNRQYRDNRTKAMLNEIVKKLIEEEIIPITRTADKDSYGYITEKLTTDFYVFSKEKGEREDD